MYVFICIGTSKIIGDSLGPYVGSYLKRKYNDNELVEVYGDINNEINYNNIDSVLREIHEKYNDDCVKIIIDAALGKIIGKVDVTEGYIYLGKGIGKNKIAKGDINIIAVVGKNHNDIYKNLDELRNQKQNDIINFAKEITKSINI